MNQWNIKALDFTLIRSPYLPANTLDNLTKNSSNANHTTEIKQSLAQIIELCKNQSIVQAIAFASENLANKIPKLNMEMNSKNLKLASSIYKYLVRMSTRSTPFGAFSSVMTVKNTENSSINLSEENRLYLRLDNSCVQEIANLALSSAIKEKNPNLLVKKNSSLYQLADEIRFVAKTRKSLFNNYHLESVKITQAIEKTLRLANQWISIGDLLKSLKDHHSDIQDQELLTFIYDLIDNQLITTNLTIVVSSDNSLKSLYERIVSAKIDKRITSKIHEIIICLQSITSLQDQKLNNHLLNIKKILAKLIPDYNHKKWLHVDSFKKDDQQSLSKDFSQPLLKSVNNIAHFLWRPNQELEEFTQRFMDIYGDAQVPLLKALDADSGIAFGQARTNDAPLLKGLMSTRDQTTIHTNWQPLDQFFISKIIQTIVEKKTVAHIKSEEIKKYEAFLTKTTHPLQSSISIHGAVLKGEDHEHLYQIKSISGPSALSLLGRFCCGDSTLLTHCQKIAEIEQKKDTDAIYAEIIHIPQDITANISCRPKLRDYEIIYGDGDSHLDINHQINCDDLYLIVKNQRLCLFSKSLQKEIKPRLASAHNTSGLNLPVYQFLYAMQGIDGWFTNITLNPILRNLAYLPEIRIDDLIISEQRWLLNKKEIISILKPSSIEEKISQFIKLKEQRNIPRYITLADGDNQLEFDTCNEFSLMVFVNEIKNKSSLMLLSSQKQRACQISDIDVPLYRHEFIIPAYVENTVSPILQKSSNSNLSLNTMRLLSSLPNENWKYLKIYTGQASIEQLISTTIAPTLNLMIEKGLIKKWFFIRYVDSDHHLRVRLQINQSASLKSINEHIYHCLRESYRSGLIKKISESTYTPEISRYGGTRAHKICEELFHHHSVMIAHFIKSTQFHSDKETLRWQIALHLAWRLTSSFCKNLREMSDFYKEVAHAYDHEFANKHSNKIISQNYRRSMQDVIQTINPDNFTQVTQYIQPNIFAAYKQTVKKLNELLTEQRINPLPIIQSIIHMDCNRTFIMDQRANEWIIFHYLSRYCKSAIARKLKVGTDVSAGLV